MDDLAVAGAGFRTKSAVPFEDQRIDTALRQLTCASQAYDTGSDHDGNADIQAIDLPRSIELLIIGNFT